MNDVSDTTAPGALELIRDLVNTRDVETGRDTLDTPEGLADWAARHGLPPLGATPPLAVRQLREALRAVLLAHTGSDVPPATSQTLGRLLDAAPLVLRLDRHGAAALVPAPHVSGVHALTARVATAIAQGQASGGWQRLKACQAHDCQWAYYDRSPAGRRRWCSMQVCGARSKMRAYRARRRG